MNKKVNTLDKFTDYTYGRGTGNTTRLVDHTIQILFEGKECLILDHHEFGNNIAANEILLKKILRRLDIEHDMSPRKGNVSVNIRSGEGITIELHGIRILKPLMTIQDNK